MLNSKWMFIISPVQPDTIHVLSLSLSPKSFNGCEDDLNNFMDKWSSYSHVQFYTVQLTLQNSHSHPSNSLWKSSLNLCSLSMFCCYLILNVFYFSSAKVNCTNLDAANLFCSRHKVTLYQRPTTPIYGGRFGFFAEKLQ